MDFKQKYLKYKEKYLALKGQYGNISLKGGASVGDFIVNAAGNYIGILKELVGDSWQTYEGTSALVTEENSTWFVYDLGMGRSPGSTPATGKDLVHFPVKYDRKLRFIHIDLRDWRDRNKVHIELIELANMLVTDLIEIKITTSFGNFHYALFLLGYIDLGTVQRLILHNQATPEKLAGLRFFLPRMPLLQLLDIRRDANLSPRASLRHDHAIPQYERDVEFVAEWAAIRAVLPAACKLLTKKKDDLYPERDERDEGCLIS